MIRDGARTLLGVGLVLACFASTMVRADLQIDETLAKSEPWTIGYNSSLKGCVASATSDDGTKVWIGFDGSVSDSEIPPYLAFTNPNWRSIEPRKFYKLQIQAFGSHRWRGYGSGVDRPNEKGIFVFGVKRSFLQEFAQTSQLVLSLNKEVLTRTNISGSSDALEKLTACQQHQIIASKNQRIETTKLVEEAQPALAEQPVADPELKGDALVRAIKQELKRVGCYDGRIDEDWQTAPARASIQKFARLAHLTISPAEPTSALLDAIRAKSERICPLECGRRQIEKDGRCIAKNCPGGFELDDHGDCALRRRTATRHETNEDEDRPRVRSYEPKWRARADAESGQSDRKKDVIPGRRITCGLNGCKKVPMGCHAVRQPDGGTGNGGKILCP